MQRSFRYLFPMVIHEYHKIAELERIKEQERESMSKKFSIDNIMQRHSLQSDSLNHHYSVQQQQEFPDSLDGKQQVYKTSTLNNMVAQ